MIEQDRFALNRAVFPRLDIAGFFELASRLGIHKVELRNDIPSGIVDGLPPHQVRSLAEKHRIKIITINRFPDFNDVSRLPELLDELTEMLDLAVEIACEAIVLVPAFSKSGAKSREQVFEETVEALKTLQPYFEERQVFGYIETLGFRDCSMRSPIDAMKAIRESGASSYKTVYDTFHHFIGPDTPAVIENEYDVFYTGLVHLSGVASDVSPDRYTDELRVMVGPDDKMGNISQIALLEKLGYRGSFSFEPFSKAVRGLDIDGVEHAIRQSMQFIQKMTDRPASPSRESAHGTT